MKMPFTILQYVCVHFLPHFGDFSDCRLYAFTPTITVIYLHAFTKDLFYIIAFH